MDEQQIDSNDFAIIKEKIVIKTNEPLPPGWKNTGRQIKQIETEKQDSIQESRILQTEQKGVLRNKIAQYIDSATQTVCISSFIISDNYIIQTLINAANRDVRVYLLTASEIQLFKDSLYDSDFQQERMQEHKEFLDNIAGKILVRTGENLHSKFVLTDPNRPDPRGFLLTANITTEALTRNLELGVNLYPREILDLFRQFLIGFWKESDSELLEPGSISKNKSWDKPLREPESTLFTIKNQSTIKNKIMKLLNAAKSEIIVSTYGIELNHEVTQNIIHLLKTGKTVKIIARPRSNKKTMDALIALANQGAEIRGHPWLHAKSILVDTDDGWSGMIMTANIEQHGLNDGFESGLILNNEESAYLHRVLDNWYRDCPKLLIVNKKLGDVLGPVQLWKNDTYQDTVIKQENAIDLGTILVPSIEELHSYQPRIDEKNVDQSIRYHQVKYSWTNIPPKLPADAEKDSKVGPFDLYKHKGKLYLVIKNPSQIKHAIKTAFDLKATPVCL